MEQDAALEAVFMPVQPPSTFEETVERLGTAIRLGLLAPGSQLPAERETRRRPLVRAAGRAGGPRPDRLDQLIEAMSAQTEDFEEYRRTDLRFHIGLAEAAGSPRLVAAMTDVQAQMTDLIALIPHPPEVLARSNEGHAKIVKALRREDGAGARGLVREHTEGTEHILAGLLPARAQDLIRSPA